MLWNHLDLPAFHLTNLSRNKVDWTRSLTSNWRRPNGFLKGMAMSFGRSERTSGKEPLYPGSTNSREYELASIGKTAHARA